MYSKYCLQSVKRSINYTLYSYYCLQSIKRSMSPLILGIPLSCDADHNWETLNGACYKVYLPKKNWRQAKFVSF